MDPQMPAADQAPADYTRAGLLQAPSPFVFGFDDVLQVDSLDSPAGVVLTIAGVILTFDCELRTFEFTHTPNTNRTLATTRQQIGPGWLLRVRAIATSGTPNTGQCFVWLRTARGLASSARVNGTITSGYLTATSDLFWPGQEEDSPLDGEGVIRSIVGTAPAAGAEINEVVPTGARWELYALQAALTTSAVVANRWSNLRLDDSVNPFFISGASQVLVASQTITLQWAQGGTVIANAQGIAYVANVPTHNRLAPGFRIRSSTSGIDAGDQWSAPRYLVREWLEGA